MNITVEAVQMYLAAAGTENVDMADDMREAAMAVRESSWRGWSVSCWLAVK